MTKETKTPVFSAHDLITSASNFGTKPEIMVGALYGTTEPITMEQARKKLADFLKKPVKGGK